MTKEYSQAAVDAMLADDMAKFFDDPYGYVLYAYKWGEGELKGRHGPFKWQKRFLIAWGERIKKNGFNGIDAVEPIRMARASGHGIGKSALTAWIVDFIMSTRPFCKGTVTANTSTQLETKTWAEVAKWTTRCITSHWFVVNTGRGNMRMFHKDHKESWFCSAHTCRKENSEAFAGQHAVDSTSFYVFDEASAVPDKIFEVSEGGLTDGEPMQFFFGNPTQNTGRFVQCFKKDRRIWNNEQIDSREVPITNKKYIAELIERYGDDSDYIRIRVKGMFPRASSKQFIPNDIVEAASGKVIHVSDYMDRPKILAVDIARFGDDQTVFAKRQGLAVYGLQKFRNLATQDCAGLIAQEIRAWRPDAVFLDMGNTGAAVYDLLKDWKYDITGVWFGGKADDDTLYFNKRVEMYGKCKEWLRTGGSIPDDEELRDDLIGPEYGFTSKEQFQLERKEDMKKRGLASPDCSDAVVLTWAYPVAKKEDALFDKRTAETPAEYDVHGRKRKYRETPNVAITDYDLFKD